MLPQVLSADEGRYQVWVNAAQSLEINWEFVDPLCRLVTLTLAASVVGTVDDACKRLLNKSDLFVVQLCDC